MSQRSALLAGLSLHASAIEAADPSAESAVLVRQARKQIESLEAVLTLADEIDGSGACPGLSQRLRALTVEPKIGMNPEGQRLSDEDLAFAERLDVVARDLRSFTHFPSTHEDIAVTVDEVSAGLRARVPSGWVAP